MKNWITILSLIIAISGTGHLYSISDATRLEDQKVLERHQEEQRVDDKIYDQKLLDQQLLDKQLQNKRDDDRAYQRMQDDKRYDRR